LRVLGLNIDFLIRVRVVISIRFWVVLELRNKIKDYEKDSNCIVRVIKSKFWVGLFVVTFI